MSDNEIMAAQVRLTSLRKQRDMAIEARQPTDKFQREIDAIERDLGPEFGGENIIALNYESQLFIGRPPTFDEAMMNVLQAEASGDGKAISAAWDQVPGHLEHPRP